MKKPTIIKHKLNILIRKKNIFTPRNNVYLVAKNCTNNIVGICRDKEANTLITRENSTKQPYNQITNTTSKGPYHVISADNTNCTNNIKDINVANTSITLENYTKQPYNQTNLIKKGSNFVIRTNNKKSNIVVNRRNIVANPFISQENPTKQPYNQTTNHTSHNLYNVISANNCTSNIVDNNLLSTALLSLMKNSTQEKESSGEKIQEDSLPVENENVDKNKNNISDSTYSKVPNATVSNTEKCRVCLKQGKIPIYTNDSNEVLAETIMTIGGIELSPIDSYPEYLCRHCVKLLRSAVLFRHKAQMSDRLLRQLVENDYNNLEINNMKPEDERTNNNDVIRSKNLPTNIISEDESDDEPSDNEEPILDDTEIFDLKVIKLLKKLLETMSESTKSHTEMPEDVGHFGDNNSEMPEYVGHFGDNNTEMPEDVGHFGDNNTETPEDVGHFGDNNTEMPEDVGHFGDNSIDNALGVEKDYNTTDIFEKSTEIPIANLNDSETSEDDNFNDMFTDMTMGSTNKKIIKPHKTKNIKYKCKECNSGNYYLRLEFVKHYRENHPEKKKIECPFCQKSYTQNNLERHMFYHEFGTFLCEICGKHYNDSGNFSSHYKSHSTDFSFKCHLCPYRATWIRALNVHMKSHETKKFKCPLCPKLFINNANCQTHILAHKGERPFKCETCNKGFYRNYDLKKHIRNVHHPREYNCRFCGKIYRSHSGIRLHERNYHNLPTLLPTRPNSYIKYEMMKQPNNMPVQI